jgi:hypothetical protein
MAKQVEKRPYQVDNRCENDENRPEVLQSVVSGIWTPRKVGWSAYPCGGTGRRLAFDRRGKPRIDPNLGEPGAGHRKRLGALPGWVRTTPVKTGLRSHLELQTLSPVRLPVDLYAAFPPMPPLTGPRICRRETLDKPGCSPI